MRWNLSDAPGVTADGATDDRAALQAQLSMMSPGDELLLDVPLLMIGPGGLQIPGGVTIHGAGCRITWVPDPQVNTDRLFRCSGRGWTRLKGLNITGPGGVNAGQHAVYIRGLSQSKETWVAMERCVIRAAPGDGVRVASFSHLFATDSRVRGCGEAAWGMSGRDNLADLVECSGGRFEQSTGARCRAKVRGGVYSQIKTAPSGAGAYVHKQGAFDQSRGE